MINSIKNDHNYFFYRKDNYQELRIKNYKLHNYIIMKKT